MESEPKLRWFLVPVRERDGNFYRDGYAEVDGIGREDALERARAMHPAELFESTRFGEWVCASDDIGEIEVLGIV